MSRRPWYKRYGGDFVAGTLNLTLEQKGAYSICLDLIYDRGSAIPDDARYIAGVCGCSIRKWKSIRASLIEKGKLFETDDGLMNDRAGKEIENALKTSRKLAENGSKGGDKRAQNERQVKENNNLDQAGLKHRARVQMPDVRTQSPEGREESLSPDLQINTERIVEGADAPSSKYAFEGKIIRLNASDFENWCEAYAGGDPQRLRTLLQNRDDWLRSDEGTEQRKRWFMSTSNWLKNQTSKTETGHEAETDGSAERVERVRERLRTRFGEGVSNGPGGNAAPVLSAVQGGKP